MKFKIEATLKVAVKNIIIDADSEEEAKEQFYKMDMEDIDFNDGYVESITAVEDEEITMVEWDQEVRVFNVKYTAGCDPDDIAAADEEYEVVIEHITPNTTEEEIKEKITKELRVDLSWYGLDFETFEYELTKKLY